MARNSWDVRRRPFWVNIHLWLGIIIGFVWALQGLTGALLVFHREVDRIGGAALTDGPMLPPSRLIAAAEAAAGQPIQRLTAVGDDLRLVEARYNDSANEPQALQLDAATGRVVGTRERNPTSPFTGSGWRWVYLVHMSLMMGTPGRTLIGASGLFLFLTLLIGLLLAWPKRHAWRAAFAFSKWRSTVQQFYGWHRAAGLVFALPLIALALTGTYQAFASKIAPALGRFFPYEPMATMGHQMGRGETHEAHAGISPDAALAIARTRYPEGRFMNLELPVEHPAHYSVRFTLEDELRSWSGRATVQIDPHDGTILATYDPRSAPVLNRLDDAAYPVHKGEAAGLFGRILVFLAGLVLPALYVTGLFLWFRKRALKAKTKRRPVQVRTTDFIAS